MSKYFLIRYVLNRKGATVIEYALLAAGIALAIVGVVFVVGDDLVALFTAISDAMASALEARA